MARLTAEQWEQARAEYEVRGISLGEVARKYGVDRAAVSRRAKNEGWIQGKCHGVVEAQCAAHKALQAAEAQSHALPVTYQLTIEQAVKEQLEAEGLLAALSNRIASRAIALTVDADTPEALETLSRVKRNLMPQQAAPTTTVNVSQAQAQQAMTPEQVCDELIAQQRAEIEAENGAVAG